MDIATLVGLVSGFIFIVVSILISGSSIMLFIDMPSVFIVFGGCIASLLVSYPLPKFLEFIKAGKHAFKDTKLDASGVLSNINRLALAARKDGLLALEELANTMDDKFLAKGILLIVDGTQGEVVRDIMEIELGSIEDRHKERQGFWAAVAELGPAWGMIGTLLGLVAMLASLDDPDTIGPSMAVALITTLYGSLIANFIATPISNKLKIKSDNEILIKQLTIEGVLAIQAGENPRVIDEKLKAFLPPDAITSVQSVEE